MELKPINDRPKTFLDLHEVISNLRHNNALLEGRIDELAQENDRLREQVDCIGRQFCFYTKQPKK